MSREQVESLLGAPDDWGGHSLEYPKATILKYGDVEFHFDPNAKDLVLIHMDDFDVPAGGKSVNLDPWIIRQSLGLGEAKDYLSHSGIGYEVIDYEDQDKSKHIVVKSGVKLLFVGEGEHLRAVSHPIPAAI
jgi:hypothetical protein